MFKNKTFLGGCILFVVSLLIGVIFYDQLPNQVPIHFNSQNIADGYANKAFAMFLTQVLLFLVHLFVVFMTQKDPKYKNMSTILLNIIYWIIPILSVLIQISIIYYVLVKPFSISLIMGVLMSFLLILTGNYLPKCKQNMTMGIKTPWTLYDEDNWNKTHRLGGICFVVAGILALISIFLNFPSYVLIIIVLFSVFIPFVYSYLLYSKTIKGEK